MLLYGRGPAGPGLFSCIFLNMIGIWRFARVPRTLKGNEFGFVGQRVATSSVALGSYGMGGPGFFGLRFESGWVVYRLWAADGWLTLNGKLIAESLLPNERPQDDPSRIASINTLNGAVLESVDCALDSYDLIFRKEDYKVRLSLRRDGRHVPVWRGTGCAKVFADHERLEDAIIISRVGRLWLWQ